MVDKVLYEYDMPDDMKYDLGISGYEFSLEIQNLFIDENAYIIDTGNWVSVNNELSYLIYKRIKKHPIIWDLFFGSCFKKTKYDLKYNLLRDDMSGYKMSIFMHDMMSSKHGKFTYFDHYQNTNIVTLNYLKGKIKKHPIIWYIFFKVK